MYSTVISSALLPVASFATAQREDGQLWPCNPIKNATGACPPNPGLSTSKYEMTPLSSGQTSSSSSAKSKSRCASPMAPGIISSSVLISDDFDEIDFEFSGNNFGVPDFAAGIGQNNYFGKGVTGDYDRGLWFDVSRPQETFRTYSVEWRKANLKWGLDGRTVRTHEYRHSSGDSGNYQYPQTPSKFQLGIWAEGDPGQNAGTKSWAGGETDVDGGPYTMFVRQVTIHNYNPASAYNWTNQSGKWQSIQLLRNPEAGMGGPSSSVKPPSTTTSSTSRSSSRTSSTSSTTSVTSETSSSTTSVPSTTGLYSTTNKSSPEPQSSTPALSSTEIPSSGSTKPISSISKCATTLPSTKTPASSTKSTAKCTTTTTTPSSKPSSSYSTPTRIPSSYNSLPSQLCNPKPITSTKTFTTTTCITSTSVLPARYGGAKPSTTSKVVTFTSTYLVVGVGTAGHTVREYKSREGVGLWDHGWWTSDAHGSREDVGGREGEEEIH